MRALFKSMGFSDNDLDRPLIGIANSWNRLVSGHYNLKQVAEYVAQGILQAGGTPAEFGVIGACDGIASGHEGMRCILPSRDLIAGSIEIMVQADRLDGIVLLGSCDKIVPGMREMATAMKLLYGRGLAMATDVVTDGRFSGTNYGKIAIVTDGSSGIGAEPCEEESCKQKLTNCCIYLMPM